MFLRGIDARHPYLAARGIDQGTAVHWAAAPAEPAVVVVEDLVERSRRVTPMLDGDPAGRGATATIAARLPRHGSVQVIPLPAQVHSDQLSEEAIQHLLEPAFGQA